MFEGQMRGLSGNTHTAASNLLTDTYGVKTSVWDGAGTDHRAGWGELCRLLGANGAGPVYWLWAHVATWPGQRGHRPVRAELRLCWMCCSATQYKQVWFNSIIFVSFQCRKLCRGRKSVQITNNLSASGFGFLGFLSFCYIFWILGSLSILQVRHFYSSSLTKMFVKMSQTFRFLWKALQSPRSQQNWAHLSQK